MHKPILIDKLNTPYHGRFSAIRKFDIHTGYDIYCDDGTNVYSIEEGVVANISYFTGTIANSPWWEETMSISIKGKSGIILYGEIYEPFLKIGDKVEEGQILSKVKRVLKKDNGLPRTMLHIELYESNYEGEGEIWLLNQDKPSNLKNIEIILNKIYGEN